MSVKVGDIVISKRGHDAKKLFIVIAALNESYVLIGDGVKRKLDSLKQKNVKHLKVVASADETLEYIVDDKSIADKLKQMQTQNL
ncbi:MAG: hypothetical protein K2G37_05515 [Clostridia bacterium]|nr:hypothetical protein [Clostridia bacterium]MDE7329002.1 hypothetical protein [Clostridia bacterium]